MKRLLTTYVFSVLSFFLISNNLIGQIIFDGSPGIGPPPSYLGGHLMTKFPEDMSPSTGQIMAPNLPNEANSYIFTSNALTHFKVASSWPTLWKWGHGYTGDVYYHELNTLPNQTDNITLPPKTRAFYLYATYNWPAQTSQMELIANDLVSSGPITIYRDDNAPNPNAGARYFGFYSTDPNVFLTSIKLKYITASRYGVTFGEFGINRGLETFAPTNLIATRKTCGSIDLTWNDIIGGTEESYELYRSTNSGAFDLIATPAANSISYTDQNLPSNASFTYFIRGRFGYGFSPWSNFANARTNCEGSSNLGATSMNCYTLKLNWDDEPAGNEESYELYRSETGANDSYELIATPNANVLEYNDVGLNHSTKYYYKIRARFGSGFSLFSNIAEGTTICNAPQNLAVYQPEYQLNVLSWSDIVGTNEESYEVYRSDSGINGPFQMIGTTTANGTIYVDNVSNSYPNTKYYYVRGRLSYGYTPASNIVEALPNVMPLINLSVSNAGCNSLQLKWDDDHLHFEEVFLIYRATSASGPFQLIGNIKGDSDITQFIDNNLDPNKTYFYKIEESNWYHSWPIIKSNLVESRTNCDNSNFGNLSANTLNCSQIKLSWIDIGYRNEESYEVYRSKSSDGPYTLVGLPIQNATEWVDGQLNSNTNYYYKIRARFNDGFSNFSSIAATNTMPIDLKATSVTNTKVRLEWEICSPEREKWIIKASSDNLNYVDIGEAPSLTNFFEASNLMPNTNYTFVIQPVYTNGFSNWSNPVSVKTPTPPAVNTASPAVNTSEHIRIVAYSNPTTDVFNFKISADIIGKIDFVVVDNFGNIRIKKHQENLEMNKEYRIDTSKLREGNYLMYIIYNNLKQPFFVKFNKIY